MENVFEPEERNSVFIVYPPWKKSLRTALQSG